MNQLYRALHMPPARLARKLTGEKEIYTIAVRRAPVGQGTDPLPALGEGVYTPLPSRAGWWFADPILYNRGGTRYLFAEAMDCAAGKGRIEVCTLDDDGTAGEWQTALDEPFHLSFPMVFDWGNETYMLPESGADHSLRLYRCAEFPVRWELAARFEVGTELCDAIITKKTNDTVTILCSETRAENQLLVRWRRYELQRANGAFSLESDEAFNLQHRIFGYTDRNAGPLFAHDGQTVHPTQVSTKVDYGVYVQFFVRRAGSEVPLCAATPQNVQIAGINARDVIGVHTYGRDDRLEVMDARYLTRV